MNLSSAKIGTIYQINPETTEHEGFGGQFIVATDLYEWGIQGYLLLDVPDTGLVRFQGRAFLRLKWRELFEVGHVEWMWEPKKEVENGQT